MKILNIFYSTSFLLMTLFNNLSNETFSFIFGIYGFIHFVIRMEKQRSKTKIKFVGGEFLHSISFLFIFCLSFGELNEKLYLIAFIFLFIPYLNLKLSKRLQS